MKSPLYLFCCLNLFLALLGFAHSQSCDSWLCPGSALDFLVNLLDPDAEYFNGQQTELPNLGNQIDADPERPPSNQDTSETELLAPHPNPGGCNSFASAPDLPGILPGISPGVGNIPCESETATQQMIWVASCENTVDNTVTENLLQQIDGNYLTSINPLCPVERGVLFWVAMLTPQEIEAIQRLNRAVKDIIPDIPYKFEDFVSDPTGQGIRGPQIKRSYPKNKRDTVSVVKQQTEDRSLSFLSTPPGKSISGTYSYFAPAGRGVRVFLIDTGVSGGANEFSSLPQLRWIYAIDTDKRALDSATRQTPNSGTCVASKVGGRRFGVAKNAELVVVKVTSHVSSFIDGLTKLILDLDDDENAGRHARGRTVINMRGGFTIPSNPTGEILAGRIEWLISDILVNRYQVVVVTSGALEAQDKYPALLARKPNINIITVGSVVATNGPNNGERYAWSGGGSAVTVSAPGNGDCTTALQDEDQVVAPDVSSAIVSGLVAYFLSLPDLAPELIDVGNTPKAVIKYLKTMSCQRYQNEYSVWNGLDSEDDQINFDNWIGSPIPK